MKSIIYFTFFLVIQLTFSCQKEKETPVLSNDQEKVVIKDLFNLSLYKESGFYVVKTQEGLDTFAQRFNLFLSPNRTVDNCFWVLFSVLRDISYDGSFENYEVIFDHKNKFITILVDKRNSYPNSRADKIQEIYDWGSIPISNQFIDYQINIEKTYAYE